MVVIYLHEVLSQKCLTDPLLLNECGICRQRRDQHLLAKCDTCHLYYHLNCLNPPLMRLPKKSKLYEWQCSEYDKTSDSDVEEMKTPRRSRSRYSKEVRAMQEFTPIVKIKPLERSPDLLSYQIKSTYPLAISTPNTTTESPTKSMQENTMYVSSINTTNETVHNKTNADSCGEVETIIVTSRSGKKRRRDKHKNRYSPELGLSVKEHKRKRKKKSLDNESPVPHPRITIKVSLKFWI